mmetsp:Transcript_135131/g.350128  ORF Transcript_135131/g.350128 Transcript_135131/m.350128 type:complete len:282 (-) Transcript_135131:673-1518(-)
MSETFAICIAPSSVLCREHQCLTAATRESLVHVWPLCKGGATRRIIRSRGCGAGRQRGGTGAACHHHAVPRDVNLVAAFARCAAFASEAERAIRATIPLVADIVALPIRASAPTSPSANIADLPVVVAPRCCWRRLRRGLRRGLWRGLRCGLWRGLAIKTIRWQAEASCNKRMIRRPTVFVPTAQLQPTRQDVIDPSMQGFRENTLDNVDRSGADAAIKVTHHDNNIAGPPVVGDARSPIVADGGAAIPERPMSVDEQDGRACCAVTQAHPRHPPCPLVCG